MRYDFLEYVNSSVPCIRKPSRAAVAIREPSIGAGEVCRRKRVKYYKIWVTHDQENVNHTLVTFRATYGGSGTKHDYFPLGEFPLLLFLLLLGVHVLLRGDIKTSIPYVNMTESSALFFQF